MRGKARHGAGTPHALICVGGSSFCRPNRAAANGVLRPAGKTRVPPAPPAPLGGGNPDTSALQAVLRRDTTADRRAVVDPPGPSALPLEYPAHRGRSGARAGHFVHSATGRDSPGRPAVFCMRPSTMFIGPGGRIGICPTDARRDSERKPVAISGSSLDAAQANSRWTTASDVLWRGREVPQSPQKKPHIFSRQPDQSGLVLTPTLKTSPADL